MKKKVWIISVIVMVTMVVMVGGPNASAEEWKTYYNPDLKFAIDYPLHSGPDRAPTNITTETTANSVNFELDQLSVTISANQDSLKGPEETAVAMQQTVLENWKDAILEQGVETVLYNGELGYRFAVFTPSDHLSTEMIFFHSPNIDYKHYDVSVIGVRTVGFPMMVDDFMSTIRFFS